MNRVLEEGSNCWRVAPARRAAFIIDGESYFRAVHESLCRAKRSIFIVGWDIHSELRLIRNGDESGLPATLGALLDALASKRPDLHIYILSWDFAMIYTMEREFFPRYKLRWKSHDRVRFCLDGEHPAGASQHQKLVVVDGQVGFCGGIDLGKWRWDSSAHAVDDERRTDPDGNGYPPFHDVQMAVDGEAAAALADLARMRWKLASGVEPVESVPAGEHDPWPPSVEPALTEVDIAISRTLPLYEGRHEIREVEQLYLDSIASARRFIYIENQYFSSHQVGEALAARLQEADGPEVVVVMPDKTGGWLEQNTMDVLRGRLLRKLREADQHDRLRVYYPQLSQDPSVGLMVHAKVMVVDDRIVRVGSSNLSNRSMGLDSECDLAIESNEPRDCAAIAHFRQRLLAEHLGVSVSAVSEAEGSQSSLIKAVEHLHEGERTLQKLPDELPALEPWLPDSAVLDPEKPVEPDELLAYFVGPRQRKPIDRNLLRVAVLLAAVLSLAAAWRWTPLGDWFDVDRMAAIGQWLDSQPLTPLLVLGVYVIAGLLAVPITLLIVATMVAFGPWLGTGYALAGAELSALAAFGLGHALGRSTLERAVGSSLNRIRRTLSRRGLLTTVTVRIVPVAPFSVINVIAGVSDIRLRDFALGTAIGMLPGVLAIALLTDRIAASLRDPSASSIAVVLVAVVLAIAGLYGLRRWLREHGSASDA